MTFSDLEYYVHEGLGLSGVIDRMAQSYRYIIIDEFQDTSPIQFKIITKMIKENYQRLFCVGDKKQAIYGF